MFTILGSGFGLYGYLPALIAEFGGCVILPTAYKDKVVARSELRHLGAGIKWADSHEDCLSRCTGAVLAQRPRDQERYIIDCLRRENILELLLEKPLATTPDIAGRLLEEATSSGKTFRIGYIFRNTSWSVAVRKRWAMLTDKDHVSVSWSFRAHHITNRLQTWKRDPNEGGGPIRFYGIHLIAWLSEMGYNVVRCSYQKCSSDGEPQAWTATFTGANLPICDVEVNLFGSTVFSIKTNRDKDFLELRSPFDAEPASPTGLDTRISPLRLVCRSLRDKASSPYRFYSETIELWRQVEKQTIPVATFKAPSE